MHLLSEIVSTRHHVTPALSQKVVSALLRIAASDSHSVFSPQNAGGLALKVLEHAVSRQGWLDQQSIAPVLDTLLAVLEGGERPWMSEGRALEILAEWLEVGLIPADRIGSPTSRSEKVRSVGGAGVAPPRRFLRQRERVSSTRIPGTSGFSPSTPSDHSSSTSRGPFVPSSEQDTNPRI